MTKYKALNEYNYYDGPVMLTASAPSPKHPGINEIFWLVWDEELEDFSRTYRVRQLTGMDEGQFGRYVETIHEDQIDWSELVR